MQTRGTALSSNPSTRSSWSPPANGQQVPVSQRGSFQASPHLQPLRSQTASLPCRRKWTKRARTRCSSTAARGGPSGQPVRGKERVSGGRHSQSGTATQCAGLFCSLERKQEKEGPESSWLHHRRLQFFFFFLLKFLLNSLSQQPTQCGPLPRRYQRHFE